MLISPPPFPGINVEIVIIKQDRAYGDWNKLKKTDLTLE